MFKLTKKQAFDLIFRDVLDNENSENFTFEFLCKVNDVIDKIREMIKS